MQFGPIGATVARQIPVLKVTCSNHVSVTRKSRAPPHGVSRNSRVPRTQAAARPCRRSPSRRRRSAPTRSPRRRRPPRYRGRVLTSRQGGVAQWQSVRFACGKPRVQTPAPPAFRTPSVPSSPNSRVSPFAEKEEQGQGQGPAAALSGRRSRLRNKCTTSYLRASTVSSRCRI